MILTRPQRPEGSGRRAELEELLVRRDRLDTAIELHEFLQAERLDDRLRRHGFQVAPRTRRPRQRERAELTGGILRRGPEVWGDRVRAYVR